MGYELCAVIGAHARVVAVSGRVGGHPARLTDEFGLMPCTDELLDSLGPSFGESDPPGFRFLNAGLAGQLRRESTEGPIVYVEADFFGGSGMQGAVCFDDGTVRWSSPPQMLGRGGPTPISAALRMLGVNAPGHRDEFDAVGLGRHRETPDWLEEPELDVGSDG